MDAKRGRKGAVIALACGALVVSGAARADGDSEAYVAWSFPEDGAADVPTDADLFLVLGTGSLLASILLDGVEVHEGGGSGSHALPPLAPNEEHVVVVTFDDGHSEPTSQTITFRTGAGPARAAPPADPAVRGWTHASEDGRFPGPCDRFLWLSGCYDEGPLSRVTLDVDGDAIVRRIDAGLFAADDAGRAGFGSYTAFWPASCGDPSVLVFSDWLTRRARADSPEGQDDHVLCFEVTAFDATGGATEGAPFCLGDDARQGAPGGCGGCTGDAPAAALVLAAASLGRLRRRVRAR